MGQGIEKKKRKISGEFSSEARKKVNTQASSQPQILRVASVKSTRVCPPIIATSPGLCLPESINFETYAKPELPTPKRSKKDTPPPTSLVLHSSSHRTLDYTAKEDGPGGRESHLKHYVGVFDEKTGQLSIMEAKKMAVRGVVRSQKAPEENMAERIASKTNLELRNNLGEAFGTKKARKAIAAITENAIASTGDATNADGTPKKLNASSQAMMESIHGVTKGMATTEELQAAIDQAKPVPSGNFDAQEIQDVYTPEQLIGTDILNSIPIKEWQDAAKNHAELRLPYQFISYNMYSIAAGPNSTKRLRVLKYLYYLITFLKIATPARERGVLRVPRQSQLSEKMENAPVLVIESIRRKFSTNGEMRKFHKDLLMTYCCVIAAILSNYEFDTSALRIDLGVDEKQFAQYFREIGGRISQPVGKEKGTKRQVAKLALPLEFPKVRFVSRRR